MAVLGLTGNLASGKSTVLRILKKKGAVVFDADKRVHQYYKKKNSLIYKKIKVSFPKTIKQGIISRKKLAEIVFADKDKLKMLEAIVHPVITKELIVWIKKANLACRLPAGRQGRQERKIYIAEVPLLFEKKLANYFDAVVLILVKPKALNARVIKKYNFSKPEAQNRLALYGPIREKIERSKFIINNNLGFKELEKEVDLLWKRIKEL